MIAISSLDSASCRSPFVCLKIVDSHYHDWCGCQAYWRFPYNITAGTLTQWRIQWQVAKTVTSFHLCCASVASVSPKAKSRKNERFPPSCPRKPPDPWNIWQLSELLDSGLPLSSIIVILRTTFGYQAAARLLWLPRESLFDGFSKLFGDAKRENWTCLRAPARIFVI